ncbi:PQQ-binding-like beta-propeller repeat protein [Natrinema soli]|uniref:PQQ-binding-like beta-propeller repeat protein n=1 Tax=Natrinema soli TaxID=1930624 RepID=A0ABD5SW49_9EURY|nr:PQQ-binding-like beta-propeller repeat protein [Natrinema soli]
MYGVDPQNTGHHPTATGPSGEEVELRTVFESEGVISNSLAIADGMLYVAADNHLHAVDLATEELEWKKQVNASPSAHPTVSDKRVYAGTKDGVVAVERGSDTVLWRNDIGISSVNPVIAEEAVVGTQNLVLHRFDPESGDEKPLHNMRDYQGGGPHTNVPAVTDGTVYFAGENTLYAVDIETGEVEWEFENPAGEPLGESNPAVKDGTVYVGGEDQRLYAIDANNGSEEWSFTVNASVKCSPSIADGTIYFGGAGAGAQKLFAIDRESRDHVWGPKDLRYSVRSKPIIADGIVYVSSYHDLFALNSEDGTLKWQFESLGEGESIRASPAVSNGSLYVPTAEGHIYAIDSMN